jgi:membrane protein implicated in regulation of membrane protease activity
MNFSPTLIWFILGVVFLIAELAIPGFILVFFAAGCWITAFVIWLTHIQLANQFLVFIISSMTLLFTLRKYRLNIFKGTTRDNIDDNYADSKIGKKAVVTKTIHSNIPGEIKVMGSFWRAVSEIEIKEGQSVLIESKETEDGLTFRVKPI